MQHETVAIRRANWELDAESIRQVRTEVFVVEQGVPIELEIDGLDPTVRHVLAVLSTGEPIGTARLLDNGQIGRIAVLKRWRGKGIGRQLVETLIQCARDDGRSAVFLHSQTQAVPFYEKLGFRKDGSPPFDDAGIPHVHMDLTL
ncbi:MAG: GNAT family N-acetyltransferase [Opitutaceae bacterium]